MIALRNLLLASALVLPVATWADDSHHPEAKGATAAPATTPSTKAAAPVDLEGHMQKMQAMLDKMKAAKTPAARQKLMKEHHQLMQEGMTMMKDMEGCPGMKSGMGSDGKGGMGMGDGKGMGMMHQMMEHMMQMDEMMMKMK